MLRGQEIQRQRSLIISVVHGDYIKPVTDFSRSKQSASAEYRYYYPSGIVLKYTIGCFGIINI